MATSEPSSPKGQSDLYRAIVNCSRDLHTLVDSTGRILYQSPSIAEVLGWQPEEVQGTNVLEYAHEDDHLAWQQEFAKVLEHPGQSRRTMLRMRRKDGSWQDSDSVIRNELDNPDLQGILIETRELVAGPELHRGLQNSEHLFETIVSHPSIMIWAIDKEGLITVSEGAGLQHLGIEPGALVGADVFELYAELPAILDYMRRALSGETLDYSITMLGAHGELSVDNRLRPQFNDRGEVVGVTAITFEVNERIQLENKLRRAETMEAIGMLVGGVAHDFNNLLTAIIGFATVAKRADDSKRAEYLEHVLESAERGASLVRQLLSFARKDEIRPETVDVSQLLASGMPLYTLAVGDSVAIHLEVDEGAECEIRIDRTKLEQVFLNLVTNARDAMPDGGTLRIHLRCDADASGERRVQIEFSDTGAGIEPAILKSVFDPFFSTKKQGSGLGLATSHSIVSRAAGTLSVESEIGKGTRFTLSFPSQPAAEVQQGEVSSAALPARPGGILLIDDDIAVLRSTALTLEEAGFAVWTAESGQQGYDLFIANQRLYDIVVTDMTMPGMKGDELAQRLREVCSQTPILCVSGYHHHSELLAGLSGVSLLNKPYHGDELIDSIIRILSGSQPEH
jgi:PAS domain S-box-containing protein